MIVGAQWLGITIHRHTGTGDFPFAPSLGTFSLKLFQTNVLQVSQATPHVDFARAIIVPTECNSAVDILICDSKTYSCMAMLQESS